MKRVLLVLQERLLADGLESLLARKEGLQVFNGSHGYGEALAVHLAEFQPEVLILEKNLELVDLPAFLKALCDYPSLKIVIIETRRNRAYVYDKQELKINNVSDFISAIL